MSGIHEGSGRASSAINEITQTMSRIQESASSIASAVTQQTATTREIGGVSAVAAEGAWDISDRVNALHAHSRNLAYAGAGNDATQSKGFELLENTLRRSFGGDDQPASLVDLYSALRGPAMLWESPELLHGEHTLHFTVAGKKHADSLYFWVAVAWVEIVA